MAVPPQRECPRQDIHHSLGDSCLQEASKAFEGERTPCPSWMCSLCSYSPCYIGLANCHAPLDLYSSLTYQPGLPLPAQPHGVCDRVDRSKRARQPAARWPEEPVRSWCASSVYPASTWSWRRGCGACARASSTRRPSCRCCTLAGFLKMLCGQCILCRSVSAGIPDLMIIWQP